MRSLLTLIALSLCLALVGADKAKDRDPGKDDGKKQGKTHDISIKKLKYNPDSLTIHVGDTVVWTNNDDRDQTVEAKDGTFNSDTIRRGEKFKFTFDKAGKFPYFCSLHPRMKGVVIVEGDRPAKERSR